MPQHKALFLKTKHGVFEVGTTGNLTPGRGDILVKILATALNPVDWKIQKYGLVVENFPAIIGADSAGIVEQVGEDVTCFKQGDRVFHQGFYTNDKATFQEYTTVPAEIAAKIPENISFDEAASVPLGLATAAVGYYNPLEDGGAALTPSWEPTGEGKYNGQGVLILGGSSSVGQYAIQLARLSGFSPIVTTASLHNTDLLKSLGATNVIDRKADVVAEAQKIFASAPSIVYDAISESDTQQQGWKVLAPNGILIIVLPPNSIKPGEDGKQVAKPMGNVHVQRNIGKSLYSKVTDLLESGKVKPNRVEVIPGGLAGIPSGLNRMEENKVSGVKLVVRPHETT